MKKKSFVKKSAIAALALAAAFTTQAKETGLTRENGAPVGDNQNSQTAGERGGVLLQDAHLLEKLARFDRERIPERVVHARGTGASGVFKSYGNFSDLTKAAPFRKTGKETRVFVRFSTVIHGQGSPESLRDPRGFATKFYTDQGNWDLVGNNLPVFFIRDAMKFPDMVHSLKPSPVTNVQDPNRYLDFFAHVPESLNMFTYLYSDLGIPATYREMDGNGVHAYKFVNDRDEVVYVKFHWISQQGVKGLKSAEASRIQSEDFNHLTKDLYKAIADQRFPSWELEAQLLKAADLDKFEFNPLDPTKESIRIPGLKTVKLGKMTLNEVPENFFESTEQSAFAPSNLIPGIEPSEDRLLQGRLFSYADTQRYRLGANALGLPINLPISPVNSHAQDGSMRSLPNQGGDVNYQPNGFDGNAARGKGIFPEQPAYKLAHARLDGSTQQAIIKKTLNVKQAGETYRSFGPERRLELIANFAADLRAVRNVKVRLQHVAYALAADEEYGVSLAKSAGVDVAQARKIAASFPQGF